MDSVRVTVIGVGRWGPNILRSFNGLSNAHIVNVCDSSDSRLDLVRGKVPWSRSYRRSKRSDRGP